VDDESTTMQSVEGLVDEDVNRSTEPEYDCGDTPDSAHVIPCV